MFEEFATPCRNVCGPYAALSLNAWRTPGYSSDSRYMMPLDSITVSRFASPSCSAADPVTSLNTEPGGYWPENALGNIGVPSVSLSRRLRSSSREGSPMMLASKLGVLAMVSTPSFDANIIGDPSREDDLKRLLNDTEGTPMFPRAFSGQYPPGSVFKLVTGSAALQEGLANRETVIESKGIMYLESDEYPGVRQAFNDNAAYGPQTFLQGVANSSNIYFFWLGGG